MRSSGSASVARGSPDGRSSRRIRIPRMQTLDSLRAYPNFRLLWVGDFCSNNALWLQMLTAGWLVRSLTENSPYSTFLVVTVGGMAMLPGLIMAPIAGTLGDRMDRRKLIIGIQSFMAMFSFLFAVLVGQQLVSHYHVYMYVFLGGICLSITQTNRMALIANTVPRASMANAFATNVLTIPGTRMIGPFIGGILITTLGFFWNFTLESLLYLGTVIAYMPMKTPYVERRTAPKDVSFIADLVAGFVYVWRDKRVLLYITIIGFVPNTILEPVMFLLPVFTSEVLRSGADVGGYLVAINGLGGLLMAFFIASFGFIFPKGKIILVAAMVSSVFILLFAYAALLPLAMLLIMLFAPSQTAFRTATVTLQTLIAPDEMRSRVMSLQRYSMGGVVIFSLVVGWFAEITSVSIALTAMGIIGLVVGLLFWVFGDQIRELDA
ncbi:MAG: MFS transporter [Chloroflexi bacterium]|nr:MFS transporter [Chloroflexota bacterium]